jgi:hypothetical protein
VDRMTAVYRMGEHQTGSVLTCPVIGITCQVLSCKPSTLWHSCPQHLTPSLLCDPLSLFQSLTPSLTLTFMGSRQMAHSVSSLLTPWFSRNDSRRVLYSAASLRACRQASGQGTSCTCQSTINYGVHGSQAISIEMQGPVEAGSWCAWQAEGQGHRHTGQSRDSQTRSW